MVQCDMVVQTSYSTLWQQGRELVSPPNQTCKILWNFYLLKPDILCALPTSHAIFSVAKFTNVLTVRPLGVPIQKNKGLFKEILEYKLISPGYYNCTVSYARTYNQLTALSPQLKCSFSKELCSFMYKSTI